MSKLRAWMRDRAVTVWAAPVVVHGWRPPEPIVAERVWFWVVVTLAPVGVLIAALSGAWWFVILAVAAYVTVIGLRVHREHPR